MVILPNEYKIKKKSVVKKKKNAWRFYECEGNWRFTLLVSTASFPSYSRCNELYCLNNWENKSTSIFNLHERYLTKHISLVYIFLLFLSLYLSLPIVNPAKKVKNEVIQGVIHEHDKVKSGAAALLPRYWNCQSVMLVIKAWITRPCKSCSQVQYSKR